MSRSPADRGTQGPAGGRHRRKRDKRDQQEQRPDIQSHAPGSSREQDALVGPLSREEGLKVARKNLWVYKIVHLLLKVPVRWILRVRREGSERVPRRGGVILVANHVSSFDPPALLVSLKRPFITLAKAGILAKPVKRFFVETLGGMIRVDRSKRGNQAAVEAACAAVEHGKVLAVWPEGGRSPTGRLTRAHTGVGRIALRTGAPVVPVAVLGTYELKAKHAKKIRWGTQVTVRFGEPMSFKGRADEAEDRQAVRTVTDEIMREVARLIGPEELEHHDRIVAMDLAPGQLPPGPEEDAAVRQRDDGEGRALESVMKR